MAKSFLIFILIIIYPSVFLFSQAPTTGIFFQAVARDNYANPAKDRKIYVQASIVQNSITGAKVLMEEFQTLTDNTGIFSISIGQGVRIGGIANNLFDINWEKGPYFLNLKISITPTAPINGWDYNKDWIDLGITPFGAVPYALYAVSVAGMEQKINSSDTAKLLAGYAKTINTITPTLFNNGLLSKVNIADSLTSYVTPTQLASKTYDLTPVNLAIASKLNLSDSNTLYITPSKFTNGLVGPQGIQGEIGQQGIQGLPGINGTNGTNGAIGPQGLQGEIGPQGIQGLPGINGTNGSNGAIGPQGLQGEIGPQGIQGLPGINGTNGTNGAIGSQGIQGLTGLPGNNGTNGVNGAIGPQGLQGEIGPQGLTGLPGTNGTNGSNGAIGPQGLQGEIGPQGIQGLTGLTGATGLSGTTNLISDLTTATGILPVTNGGSGTSSLTVNNVLLGNGTNAFKTLAPGTSGNVLQSNGTTWISGTINAGGVTTLADIGSSTNSKGASISGSTLTLLPATEWYGGVVSTTDQAFSGNKTIYGTLTLSGKATINGITIGRGTNPYPDNTAIGLSVLSSSTTSGYGTGVGSEALKSNTTGDYNTGVGYKALTINSTGYYNASFGANSLITNSIGHNNSAFGYMALAANTTANWNTAIGSGALFRSNSNYNTAVGYYALNSQTSGYQNTAVGYNALTSILTGYNNTAIGYNANVYDGNYNSTAIGANAVCIGNNQLQLGDYNTTPYAYGTLAYRSDARDKINVRNTNLGLDFIMNLRPVDFKYNYREAYKEISKDGVETYLPNDSSRANKKYSHGFIAQEVKAIMDTKSLEFGGFNDMKENGGKDILSLGYTEFIAPIIKAVQEQQAIIEEQKKRIDLLEKLVNQLIQTKP